MSEEVKEQGTDLAAEFAELETAFEPEESTIDADLEAAAEPTKADEPAPDAPTKAEVAEPTAPTPAAEPSEQPPAPEEAELKSYLDAQVTYVDKDGTTKRSTRRELIKAGDYDRALQTANQFPHIQKDRLELKRNVEALQTQLEALRRQAEATQQEPQPAGAAAQAPDAGMFGVSEEYKGLREHVKSTMLPQAIKSGYISESFAEVEPELAADLVIARTRMDILASTMTKVEAFVDAVTDQVQKQKLRTEFDATVDSVVREHGLPEAAAEDKSGLLKYLAEELGNPGPDKLLNKDFIREQLFAYTLRKNPALAQELLRRRSVHRAEARPAAGSTGRAAHASPRDEIDSFDQELRAAGLL